MKIFYCKEGLSRSWKTHVSDLLYNDNIGIGAFCGEEYASEELFFGGRCLQISVFLKLTQWNIRRKQNKEVTCSSEIDRFKSSVAYVQP